MERYLEIDFYQLRKTGQGVCGDAFTSRKDGERRVTVLADGLGSGIKAGVLATLTTTMAARFVQSHMDLRRAADVILETLPVCSVRKIGYSTFTIVDYRPDGEAHIIEYDNPPYILLRNGKVLPVTKTPMTLDSGRQGRLSYSKVTLEPGDRIVFFSDGVTQAGMGREITPLGWTDRGVEEFLEEELFASPLMSAGEISKRTARRALEMDIGKARDDITCAALYLREPRKTLVMTGPPYNKEQDVQLARMAIEFHGKKVICGGTTSNIISRELNLPITVNLAEMKRGSDIPPTASMPGFDLITEGTITLSRCLRVLEEDPSLESLPDSPVKKLVVLLLNSDIVHFVVGTRINESHQDPSLPRELEIRRNLMKRFCEVLENKYMKETVIEFL
jgi:serine/threonine protein phosphatase PrpC